MVVWDKNPPSPPAIGLNSEVNTHNVIHYAPYGKGDPADHFVEFEQGADSVVVWIGLTRTGVALEIALSRKTSTQESTYELCITM